MSTQWRPVSATQVHLSDHQLAQLGLLASFEAQARFHLLMALKGAAQLSFDEYKRRESRQLRQLVEELKAHPVIVEHALQAVVSDVENALGSVVIRHQALHNVWGMTDDDGRAQIWDVKRDQHVFTEELSAGLDELAQFTFLTRRCAERVADLILSGALPGRENGPGPAMRWGGRLVLY